MIVWSRGRVGARCVLAYVKAYAPSRMRAASLSRRRYGAGIACRVIRGWPHPGDSRRRLSISSTLRMRRHTCCRGCQWTWTMLGKVPHAAYGVACGIGRMTAVSRRRRPCLMSCVCRGERNMLGIDGLGMLPAIFRKLRVSWDTHHMTDTACGGRVCHLPIYTICNGAMCERRLTRRTIQRPKPAIRATPEGIV